MAFTFTDKVIYILSPEKWGKMRFSKHHYALELANLGNRVFFIEPPDLQCDGFKMVQAEENNRLSIVTYHPVARGKRFLPHFIYRILLKLQVRILLKKIRIKPDVIWSFDPTRSFNLNWFDAPVRIFFLADLLPDENLPEEARTAQFCLGLSDSRLKQLRVGPAPAVFINHGLSDYYVKKAEAKLKQIKEIEPPKTEGLRVGYIGNLMMECLDRDVMRQVISSHPELTFIFWGQYEKSGQLVAYNSSDVFSFIEFLQKQPNVKLRGPVHPEVLSKEVEEADMFWVCWKLNKNSMWDGSNPHKILEYLSTGKPLVTHYIDAYKGNEYINMLTDEDNQDYLSLFNKILKQVEVGEDPHIQKERIKMALNNSYKNQIIRVNELINQYSLIDK